MAASSASAVFERTDRELWLVTAQHGPRRAGLVATFVSNASLVPELPRVLVGIARQHHTWGIIEASGAFALHLMGEDHLDWVWRFGLQSGREVDKWEGLSTGSSTTGSPLLTEALAWLDCRVETRMNTGDRTVYLGEIVDARLLGEQRPLTFTRLLELAPPQKLHVLQELVARDRAIDAAAINDWRRDRRTGEGGS
jgi:flavin reductase (DIM6/NTAB) family NADH-FMN oxidoreductase RutF